MVWKFKLQLIRDRDETHLELALVAGGSGAATTLGAAEAEETSHEALGFLWGSNLGDLNSKSMISKMEKLQMSEDKFDVTKANFHEI